MNILVITGSPRKKGNSDLMADAFIGAALKAGHEVNKIYASDLNVHGCTACEYCSSHPGICFIKDDMQQVYSLVQKCNMLVFASPLYFYSFTAQLKNVMDRLYAGLKVPVHITDAALLMACGASSAESANGAVISYKAICDYMHWNDRGIVIATNVHNKEDIGGTLFLSECKRLAESL